MRFEPDWKRLTPQEPYRFHMGLSPGNAAQFFASTPDHVRLTTERVRWLEASPEDYCQLSSEGYPLLDEAFHLAKAWGFSPYPMSNSSFLAASANTPYARCYELGHAWEPDFLLLKTDDKGIFRLVGGVVCFPSSWSLPEKMGRAVMEIHGVVPSLNLELGRQIDAFLQRIAPGSAWERANWGLSRGENLNRHPRLNLPGLDETTPLEQIFARVEHQIFFRMPRTLGLLFGIRLSLHCLDQLTTHPPAAAGLRQALETMPEPVAQYKGLSRIRDRLIQTLSNHFSG